MTTLPSMGLTLPTRGSGGAGLWGDTLDADLALLDAHDHTSGKGARITPAAMNINADLPFSALWAPTQLHRVQFSAIAVATVTGGMTKSLFVSDGTGGLVANELYYRTNAGASVQITAGSALNVGAFVAGIGGDYAGVGAQLNYTDSSKTYDFKESTADSHGWARVQCGGIRLIEFNTTENFFVAQLAPAALAGSYAVTWPTTLPGSTLLQQVDNTGQIIWSNSLPTNTDITLSGTGDIKHGIRTKKFAMPGASLVSSGTWDASGGALNLTVTILLRIGSRIREVRLRMKDSAVGPTKITLTIKSSVDGTQSSLGNIQSAGSGAVQSIAVTGLSNTVVAGTDYLATVVITTGSDTCHAYSLEVDYDRP